MPAVGMVGLGRMGMGIARSLCRAGFDVHGVDANPARTEAGRRAGVTICARPAELARSCDLIVIMVGFEADVEAVLFGDGDLIPAASNGLIIAIASTVPPTAIKRLGERLAGTGVALVDAPVFRGEAAAADGTLLMFVGGPDAAVAACRPAFESFCSDIVHVGPLGAGQVAKMVSNMILWACLTATVEGLDLAEAMGVDRERLRAALALGSADNWALRTRADERAMLWAEKDLMILLSEADAARRALPLAGALKEAVKALKISRDLPMPD
ncbi:NAD(P)-dependent oxidoreductase [Stappia stellulata]|nr:NAD(P)-dependent oxidoreductase [Stappia stellulata]